MENLNFSKVVLFAFGIILLLVLLLCFFGGFVWLAVTPHKFTVAEVKLDDNQTIKVWYETSINDDGFGLHYYEISQGNKVIRPTTEIGSLEVWQQENYQVALNHDKTLVCVYDSVRNWGLFVLYNTQNGELWTRRPAYDHDGWEVYYEQLKAENPDLPNKSFFED
jgi:hypothetical protein